jgi:hypothetical protein
MAKLGEMTVSAEEMQRLLCLSSGKQVYELRRAGILVRANGDRFMLEASVSGFIEHLKHNKP